MGSPSNRWRSVSAWRTKCVGPDRFDLFGGVRGSHAQMSARGVEGKLQLAKPSEAFLVTHQSSMDWVRLRSRFLSDR